MLAYNVTWQGKPWSNQTMERIASALERIAEAMENQAYSEEEQEPNGYGSLDD